MLILVVDDCPDVRKMLRRILESAGHIVVEAGDGKTALQHVGQVDVAITDILMPGADGLEFLRSARAARPTLPIIVMSGGGRQIPSSLSLMLAAKLGASEMFAKPFVPRDLLGAITRCTAGF